MRQPLTAITIGLFETTRALPVSARLVACLAVFTLLLPLLFGTAAAADPEQKPAVATAGRTPEFSAEAVEFFRTKVHPLLQARCFECHSKDAKRLEGGLRLDARPLVLKGGDNGSAVNLKEPGASMLLKAVNYDEFEMPPSGKLPEGEIAIFRRWLELGLPWTDDGLRAEITVESFPLAERKAEHWAWQALTNPSVPSVKQSDWAADDIDRFILARLEAAGLTPSADADRRTLIRRAYFTLIGLPPTPAEVEQFVADPAPLPEALATVVDRLLDSPHFGERWARHWLDLARYAESLGHEFDYPLDDAWKYRDYVVRAFNADLPYDQFVREQIAGDLVPEPRRNPDNGINESLLGTGFWLLGELKHSPVDVKGEEAAIIDNQIDVFSKTFLAMTVSCSRCHDHKFDAITMQDYYGLSGFLQSSRRQRAWLDPESRVQTQINRLEDIHKQATELLTEQLDSPNQVLDTAGMLLATREVLFGEPRPGDDKAAADANRPAIVFAEFEGADFGDWKADGEAFAAGPVTGTLPNQQNVSGFSGQKLVNSYVGGDNALGTLTSPEFTINRRQIHFLIGGGSFAGKTCFNLLVDGKAVRTATGKNNERLDPAAWDVSDLAGQRAVLQIVDQQQGGWGHVNVDHVVFTDAEAALSTRRPIAIVARERSQDAAMLERWVRAVADESVNAPSHPLYVWKQLAATAPDDFNTVRDRVIGTVQQQQARVADFEQQAPAVPGFSRESRRRAADVVSNGQALVPESDLVLPTGWAFGSGAAQPDAWNPSGVPLQPLSISSARLGRQPRGAIRSPEFTITHPTLLYRIAGQGITVRLIIDGYMMNDFNGLLFGGVRFDIDHPQMHWFRQGGDVRNFIGRRAYIEITDNGDGWVVLDDVRQADPGTQPQDAVSVAAEWSCEADSFERLTHRLVAAVTTVDDGDSRTGQARAELRRWLIDHNLVGDDATRAKLSRLKAEAEGIAQSLPAPDTALAMTDGVSEDEHVFIRGSHANLGPLVPRRMLEAISGDDQPELTRGSGRLELADRLLADTNPLPARVMANRIWQHVFGRGIVESADNFGVLGKAPTHPELLDHLATRFKRDGWSVKKLIRACLLSRAWRMDSLSNPAAEESDPQNLLWHRMPIQRLEGEAIRDAMLTISGRLDGALYGPPVPVYLTPFMQGRGRPGGGPLDGQGRRSIYISVRRNFLSPMMLAFDTPIPFTSVGQRNVSNVPAQALILMNDPFVVDQSRVWARRELAEPADGSEDRIRRMYGRAFARPANDDEVQAGVAFLQAQAQTYGPNVDVAKDERIWSDLCHVLFNVKEFVFVK